MTQNSEKQKSITQPPYMRALVIILAFTLLTLTVYVYNGWKSYRYFNQTVISKSSLAEIVGTIAQLDETLTMSARMCAATGDLQWEQRYKLFEPKLDSAILLAQRVAPDLFLSEAALNTDKANRKLVEIEHQSFILVHAGQHAAAETLLISSKYLAQKNIYTTGFKQMQETLNKRDKEHLASEHQNLLFSLIFACSMLPILLLAWLTVLRTMRKHETDQMQTLIILQEKNEEIETQNEEFLQINEELIHTNQELLITKEKAEESDRLKTAFIQNMSHEIRTPMNAIMGFSELLVKNYNNKPKLEKYSEIINQRCNDLLVIINDLLDISKIESGQVTVSIDQFSINNLFSELADYFSELKVRLKKEHISFNLEVNTSDFSNEILADRNKLQQILVNLINNAFKYTSEGKIEGGFKLVENNKLLFYISDTGIGIPPDKHKLIFERFYQVSTDSKQWVEGNGLGLPIVKGLLTLLNGEIWLESIPNVGSTFYFTIPYNIAPAVHQETSTIENFNVQSFQKKTILIVEDDNSNAAYLKEILSELSLNVILAVTGNEAIQITNNQQVEIVLMDIRLPDIDGYEATRKIIKQNPNIKIIAQTAYVTANDKQNAINAGCIDYLSKPTKEKTLLEMLHKHLL